MAFRVFDDRCTVAGASGRFCGANRPMGLNSRAAASATPLYSIAAAGGKNHLPVAGRIFRTPMAGGWIDA